MGKSQKEKPVLPFMDQMRAVLEATPLRGTLPLMQNQKVSAAFNLLSAAVDAPNPVYELLQDAGETGLTKTQMQLVMLYVVFRTKPTRGEIAHFLSLIAQSSWQGPAKKVTHNLKDEIEGNPKKEIADHDKLLHACLYYFGIKLGIPTPDIAFYNLLRLTLKARATDNPSLGETKEQYGDVFFDKLKSLNPYDVYFAKKKGVLSECYDYYSYNNLFDCKDRPLMPLIPKNANAYRDELQRLYLTESADPDNLLHLAGAALRLAIREGSSSKQNGISGLTDFFLRLYGGYFDHAEFPGILAWSNEHTGNEHNGTKGVECHHSKDANDIAKTYLFQIIETIDNPDLVAKLLNQEAQLVETRTKLGEDFALAIHQARQERPEEEPIPPKYKGPETDFTPFELLLKKLRLLKPIKPGYRIRRKSLSELIFRPVPLPEFE